ncbi:17349_t:CDS:2, partial [Gigaspora margarita]
HLGTDEDLKERMAVVQFERACMNLLLSDFINDLSVIYTERNLKSRKESSWKLIVDLLEAFNMPDPASHPLFQNTSQNNNEEFYKLFACYNIGKKRLYNIYKQDIEKTIERNTTGRRARNIVVDTIAQQKQWELQEKESKKKKRNNEAPNDKKGKKRKIVRNEDFCDDKSFDPTTQYQTELSVAKKFKQIIEEEKAIKEIIEESKYYRHPDSATISYTKIAEESIGKISDKIFNIGTIGAGPSGICVLYKLSKINHNQNINISLYKSDPNNFTISEEYGGFIKKRGEQVSLTMASSRAVYEVGAICFSKTAGLIWYYARKVFGINEKVNPFSNPGAVTTEFVFRDHVDHYIGDPDFLALKIKELVKNKL